MMTEIQLPPGLSAPAEMRDLMKRLRLSMGDLLGLAREVANNGSLRSVDDLTFDQREQLITYLTFLARPIRVDN